MTIRHIMIEHPKHGTHIQRYTSEEMRDEYTPEQNHELAMGRMIFKNGAIHADMEAITRNAISDHLSA